MKIIENKDDALNHRQSISNFWLTASAFKYLISNFSIVWKMFPILISILLFGKQIRKILLRYQSLDRTFNFPTMTWAANGKGGPETSSVQGLHLHLPRRPLNRARIMFLPQDRTKGSKNSAPWFVQFFSLSAPPAATINPTLSSKSFLHSYFHGMTHTTPSLTV